MAREIGSEFHRVAPDSGHGIVLPIPGALVFSGRTAIETVLKEIPKAKKAMLPSYCCDSMIQPFRDAGIEIGFYPVNYIEGFRIDVNIPEETDVLLWCNYFGFKVSMPDLSGYNGVIIEDVTHSLLSEHPYHRQSHYIEASLRKWEPINCGGYCATVAGKLHHVPKELPPQEFIENRTTAMELKAAYLTDHDKKKKPIFLSLFGNGNHWLSENYSGLSIDQFSKDYLSTVDIEEQRRIRKRNAKILYDGLRGRAHFLFPEEDMDCPLFIPILLQNRDKVRRVLTANQIYCPVHWPKPMGCESNIYEQELSLICDQRYDEEDMRRIISILKPLL